MQFPFTSQTSYTLLPKTAICNDSSVFVDLEMFVCLLQIFWLAGNHMISQMLATTGKLCLFRFFFFSTFHVMPFDAIRPYMKCLIDCLLCTFSQYLLSDLILNRIIYLFVDLDRSTKWHLIQKRNPSEFLGRNQSWSIECRVVGNRTCLGTYLRDFYSRRTFVKLSGNHPYTV